jgi:hypothetical protein
MSDETFDPWKSLASELGVDANAVPPPPPPPSPPPALPTYFAPSAVPTEPKKASSDWSALASDLGIEVPPEPERPIVRKDPVAELLGWPAQSRVPEPQKPEARGGDDFEEREPWDADDVRGRWGDEVEKPLGEAGAESESRSVRRDDRGNRDGGPQRGRRRRGGRGRGRGGDRNDRDEVREPGVRDRADRPLRDEAYRSEESRGDEDRDIVDEVEPGIEFREVEDREREPAREGEPIRKPRRRRGRRRGRGGERPAAERGHAGDQPKRRDAGSSEAYDEPEMIAYGEDLEDVEDIERTDQVIGEEFVTAGVTTHEMHADEEEEDDDEPRGKSSVRDIMTWNEAIGIIIDTNMQERARNPRSGGHGHGGHGGRGGRGRRGGGRRNG